MGPFILGDLTHLKILGKGRSGARRYVCAPVPKELQPILRKRTVEVALNTDSKKDTQHLRYVVIAGIKRDFARALETKITSVNIEAEAVHYYARRILSPSDNQCRQYPTPSIWRIALVTGCDRTTQPKLLRGRT
jgi:hypothetical protein